MLFLSYHNFDIHIISSILESLHKFTHRVWFDRVEVSPVDNWQESTTANRFNCDFAIILLSNSYAGCNECLAELRYLFDNHIQLIGMILDDFDLQIIQEVGQFTDLIKYNRESPPEMLWQNLGTVLEQLNIQSSYAVTTERQAYAQKLIVNLNEKLLRSSLYGFINHDSLSVHPAELPVRRRGYNPEIVSKRSFELVIDEETLTIEDLFSLITIQPYILLTGTSAQELNCILQLLALMSAHTFKREETEALPVYLDISTYRPDSSIEEWVCETWRFTTDCQDWLQSRPVQLLVEATHASFETLQQVVSKIVGYCLDSDIRSFIISSPDPAIIPSLSELGVIIKPLPISLDLVPALVQDYLSDENVNKVVEIFQNHLKHNPSAVDYLNLLVEYAQDNDKLDITTAMQYLSRNVLCSRWEQEFGTVSLPISFDEIWNALEYLAWHMIDTGQPFSISSSEAIELLGDTTIIDLSLEIGAIISGYSNVMFPSKIVQDQLASHLLISDGLYKHIGKPKFGNDFLRQPAKWDGPILASVHTREHEQYDEIIELLDDIDPFIALDFARQIPSILEKYLCQLIAKMHGIQVKNPAATQAIIRELYDIDPPRKVAKCLVKLIRSVPFEEQLMLHHLLSEVPYTVDDNVLHDIHELDREFIDARAELLLQHSSDLWVVILTSLFDDTNPRLKRNAVYLAGGMDDLAILPSLYALLEENSPSLINSVIDSILTISSDAETLHRIIRLLGEEHLSNEIVKELFLTLNRDIPVDLLGFLQITDATILRHVCLSMCNMADKAIISLVRYAANIEQHTLSNLQDGKVEDEHMSQLFEVLRHKFDQATSKTMLDDFLSEIAQKLQVIPVDSGRSQAVMHAQSAGDHLANRNGETPVERIQHEDWSERYRALQELAGTEKHTSIEIVQQVALEDPDVHVRVEALRILTLSNGDHDSSSIFLLCLTDEEYPVVDAATDFFCGQDEIDTGAIVSLLSHEQPHVIAAAITILQKHRDADAIPILRSLVEDTRTAWLDEKSIAERATNLLYQLTTPAENIVQGFSAQNAPEVLDDLPLQHKPIDQTTALNPENRQKPQNESYTPEQKINLTLIALKGENWDISQKAARYLRQLAEKYAGTNNQAIVLMLENSLQDANWVVRWAVAEALGWIKSPSSITKLISALHDENWMVQIAAIRSLVELNAYDSAQDIANVLDSGNTAVAETAAEALGILKNPEVYPNLTRALSSHDEFVRLSAIQSLYKISPQESQPLLVRMLTDSYNHIRWFAMMNLSKNPPSGEVQLIASLLDDKSGPTWEKQTVGDYALLALQRIDTPESLLLVEQWESEQDNGRGKS